MDERSSHDEDEFLDNDHELGDTDIDEGGATPADTDHGSDDPKTPAEQARESQKAKWLAEIKSGKKTLDDMPENLGWLRKEIEPEIQEDTPKRKRPTRDEELDRRVQEALKKERDKEDLQLLAEDLEENATPEQLAKIQEDYAGFREDGVSPLRALVAARRLNGLHDSKTIISERRRRGMLLPPDGSRRRETVDKDKMTEIEKKLSGDLPPGFGQ